MQKTQKSEWNTQMGFDFLKYQKIKPHLAEIV